LTANNSLNAVREDATARFVVRRLASRNIDRLEWAVKSHAARSKATFTIAGLQQLQQ
jgi:hypothetical protein